METVFINFTVQLLKSFVPFQSISKVRLYEKIQTSVLLSTCTLLFHQCMLVHSYGILMNYPNNYHVVVICDFSLPKVSSVLKRFGTVYYFSNTSLGSNF